MTRWSATTPTRRSCSALAYGSRSTAAAENTSTSSYTTTGDATPTIRGYRILRHRIVNPLQSTKGLQTGGSAYGRQPFGRTTGPLG